MNKNEKRKSLRKGNLEEDEGNAEKSPLLNPVANYASFDTDDIPEPPPLPSYDTDHGVDAALFRKLITEVRYAISKGVYPVMISQGSSGSYFCKDRNGTTIGVFKPKNEEPYGHLNPKWSKWLQRTCCPCCFGRGCLIPNTGYISEASASAVDESLCLNVVPRTEIVSLASATFSYPYFDRQRKTLPEKIGSFQVFVRGYKDASVCLREFQYDPLTDDLKRQFRAQFERLVILDYITRNTDRGNDNWLIKIDTPKSVSTSPAATSGSTSYEDDWEQVAKPKLKIAAIDNGLSFPFKHPDSWRAYPFGWAVLAAAQVPFSEETKNRFLPKLIDPEWCEKLVTDLKAIAQKDPDFNEKQFRRQIAVLRGQVFNLAEALMKQKSPLELINAIPVTINQVDTSSGFRRRFLSMNLTAPTFTF